MKITPRGLVIAFLILLVPLTVTFALTRQTPQQYAQVLPPSPPPEVTCNTCQQQNLPYLCFTTIGRHRACSADTSPCKGQGNCYCVSCSQISPTITPTPTPPIITCTDCKNNNMDTLCLNSNAKTAYCTTSQDPTAQTQTGNTCVRCCIPRPPCMDAMPFHCDLAVPPDELCPPSPTPLITQPPTPTPPNGCHYQVCTRVCPETFPNCCPPILVCPSITPEPTCSPIAPSCMPGEVCPNFIRCAYPSPIVCGSEGTQMGSFNPTNNSQTRCVTPTNNPLPANATPGTSTSVSFWSSVASFFGHLFR